MRLHEFNMLVRGGCLSVIRLRLGVKLSRLEYGYQGWTAEAGYFRASNEWPEYACIDVARMFAEDVFAEAAKVEDQLDAAAATMRATRTEATAPYETGALERIAATSAVDTSKALRMLTEVAELYEEVQSRDDADEKKRDKVLAGTRKRLEKAAAPEIDAEWSSYLQARNDPLAREMDGRRVPAHRLTPSTREALGITEGPNARALRSFESWQPPQRWR